MKVSSMTNVILTGWLNATEIMTLLQCSHIGVCPATKDIDLFPNKAFAYLSTGLPVVSAFQGDLKEIIEKYGVGLSYTYNDVESIINSIIKLYGNRDLYKEMSENARRIFDEMFDAEKIYKEYVEHIEEVVARYK